MHSKLIDILLLLLSLLSLFSILLLLLLLLLQHRSRPGRDTVCQGKGKFGKLGGEKSCIVYGSARSSECEAHGPSATATI